MQNGKNVKLVVTREITLQEAENCVCPHCGPVLGICLQLAGSVCITCGRPCKCGGPLDPDTPLTPAP